MRMWFGVNNSKELMNELVFGELGGIELIDLVVKSFDTVCAARANTII